MVSMSDRFLHSRLQPVEYNGLLVHPKYDRAVEPGDVIRVTWLSAASPRVQGITLRLRVPDRAGSKGRGGQLTVDEVSAAGQVLWMDTAPPVVDVRCERVLPGAVLRISNQWRTEDGIEHSGVNNFGMLVEETESPSRHRVVLHCSDGVGLEPTFTDLAVQLDFLPSAV